MEFKDFFDEIFYWDRDNKKLAQHQYWDRDQKKLVGGFPTKPAARARTIDSRWRELPGDADSDAASLDYYDKYPPAIKPIKDPKGVANYWKKVQPSVTEFDRLINNEEAEAMCTTMADNSQNAPALKIAQMGRSVHQTRYEKPLAGNLIRADNPKFQDARAAVSTQYPEQFRFYKVGQLAGALRIIHPPLIYTEVDKSLLTSIIVHELRHAADFIDPQYDAVPPSGASARFDNNLYATNLMEARGYAQQLQYLLHKFNYNVDAVIKVLKGIRSEGPSPLRMDDDILRAAKEYLESYRMHGESHHWLANMVAPFILGITQALGGDYGPVQEPTAIVRVEEQQEVKQAAHLVHKIFSMFRLSNYVKMSQ